MVLKKGDRSAAVATIQEWLNELGYKYKDEDGSYESLAEDGIFGAKTEDVIIDFQEDNGLYSDGIIGTLTMAALEEAYMELIRGKDSPGLSYLTDNDLSLEKVRAERYKNGYDRFMLRSDVAEAYNMVRLEALKKGAILTSSGGIRGLKARVNANRSAVSFHYLGRALDLFVYSAMVNPETDPYVVTWDDKSERFFTVYARCKEDWDLNPLSGNIQVDLPQETELKNVVTYKNRRAGELLTVKGRFIHLTELFKNHGFSNIRARKKFLKGGGDLGAEWWHFQYEKGLMPGVSTFGGELIKIYTEESLAGTPPWKERNRVYKENWF